MYIHKYGPISVGQEVEIVDNGYHYYGIQDGYNYIWFANNPEKLSGRNRTFKIIGTGFEYDSAAWKPLKTLVDKQGYVWHLLVKRDAIRDLADSIF